MLKSNNNSNWVKEIKDKIIVITGGGQGIGKGLALEFAKNKARIIICSRTKKDLDLTVKEILSLGGTCSAFALDVSNAKEVRKKFNQILKLNRKIDILINCAGIYGPIGPLEKNDMDLWKKTFDINVLGTVNCIREVIPTMKKRRQGKIINFCGGGVGSSKIKPNISAYTASKSAIAILTESMANELKNFNIQVNAISPGAVNTRFLQQVLQAGELAGKDFLEESKKQKISGGTPIEKSAFLALFLATEKSNFVTGKIISAVWDNYNDFIKNKQKIVNSSLYTLRRIDDFQFKQIK